MEARTNIRAELDSGKWGGAGGGKMPPMAALNREQYRRIYLHLSSHGSRTFGNVGPAGAGHSGFEFGKVGLGKSLTVANDWRKRIPTYKREKLAASTLVVVDEVFMAHSGAFSLGLVARRRSLNETFSVVWRMPSETESA